MPVHKVHACRFDYEYMGKNVADLSRIYGFPIALIEDEIKASGWTKKLDLPALPDTKDVQAFARALEDTTRTQLSITALFRQIGNQPLIAQLEKTCLEKALELAQSLSVIDVRAPAKLKSLVEVITILQERNPVDLADKVAENNRANGNKGVQVFIANQIQ